MANGVNKAILIGNLGADPEIRHTPSGVAVCEMSVATNEAWTDKGGQKQERTEWHRVVVWNKTAENCARYLHKGSSVYVEGKITTETWDDKEGTKRYTTKIQAREIRFLGGGGDGQRDRGGYGGDSGPPASAGTGAYAGPDDDDLPF